MPPTSLKMALSMEPSPVETKSMEQLPTCDQLPPSLLRRCDTILEGSDHEDESTDSCTLSDYLPTPPDGGWGWVVVFASFMSNLIVDGISYSFGVFLPHLAKHYGQSQGMTALVGSLFIGFCLIGGPIVGGLVNRFGSRPVMVMGALLSTAALFISVWAPNLIVLMITYGLTGGIAVGLIYLPGIVHVGFYFEKRRALATGLAVSGSGIGTCAIAPLSVYLIREFGWQGALWILAGFMLNCAACGMLLRPLLPKKPPQELTQRWQEDYSLITTRAVSTPALNVAPKISVHRPEPDHSQTTMPTENGKLQRLMRIRNVLSRSAKDAINTDPSKAALMHVPAVVNETLGTPAPLSATKIQKPTVSAYRLSSAEKRALAEKRAYSHISAISFAKSLRDLGSVSGTNTVKSSIALSVDPGDLARPMSRQDIFFPGSVTRLPQYKMSGTLSAYRQSTISLPQDNYSKTSGEPLLSVYEEGDEEYHPRCRCLPSGIRSVVLEMFDLSVLKIPVMLIMCVSNIFACLGLYVPYVYLNNRAEVLGASTDSAALLLSILGISNTVGRVAFGWLSDRGWLSALTINNLCLFICGILTLLVTVMNSYPAMCAYATLFGFFIAAYITLTSIILVDYLGLEQLTNSFGVLILFRGVAAMAGSPIAGVVYDATKSYNASFYYAGGMLVASALLQASIPLVTRYRNRTDAHFSDSEYADIYSNLDEQKPSIVFECAQRNEK